MLAEEYLMVRLMEELSEMQHAISKCIRFGPRHICRVHKIPNLEKVKNEFEDVYAILALLEQFGVSIRPDQNECKKKIDRVAMDLADRQVKGIVSSGADDVSN
jgi:NTP pyrophosphatase (non-canonical NTP hydrolase)